MTIEAFVANMVALPGGVDDPFKLVAVVLMALYAATSFVWCLTVPRRKE